MSHGPSFGFSVVIPKCGIKKKKNHFTPLTGPEGQGFNQGVARKGLGTGTIWNVLIDGWNLRWDYLQAGLDRSC